MSVPARSAFASARQRTLDIGMDPGLLNLDEPNSILITGNEKEIFALQPDCAVIAINIRDPNDRFCCERRMVQKSFSQLRMPHNAHDPKRLI